MKKLWKNNKIAVLFASVIIVMILVFSFMIFPLYSSRSGSVYGTRLNGIEEVEIDDKIPNEIEKIYKETGKVEKVTTDLKGKIYNILVYVNEGVDLNEMLEVSNSTLSSFSEEQLKFYDVQYFLISDKGETKKTVVGYKNKDSAGISWTNNR